MIGVGGGELRLRLDEVYVPLRISQRPLHHDLDERAAKRRGEMALECGAGDLELEQIFSRSLAARGPHVAIFGDPGAGKTTALAKLHHHCLSAGPESLGLAAGTVPVLLRLRRLGAADLESPLAKVIGRELAETSGGELPVDLGQRLWEHGRLLLLLDGLDEIADATLRARVCKYLEWQLTGGECRHLRAVVSCRYSGYGEAVKLDERFLHLDVRPLDAEQCRHLVRLWFREVGRTLPKYPERDAPGSRRGPDRRARRRRLRQPAAQGAGGLAAPADAALRGSAARRGDAEAPRGVLRAVLARPARPVEPRQVGQIGEGLAAGDRRRHRLRPPAAAGLRASRSATP